MLYYVYILQCADQTYYVGCTNELERRLKQHNESKRGAHYTKIRRPVVLVYHEQYETLQLAMKREREIKKWTKAKKETLVTSVQKHT